MHSVIAARPALSRLASPLQSLTTTSKRRTLKMAAFSDPGYDFKGYLASRPRYPDLLYDTVLSYHKGDRQTVLDLGTGPGLSLFPFAYHFTHLIGADPSKGMIEQAEGAWEAWKKVQDDPLRLKAKDARFIVSAAEELTGVEHESVDLITAATAAHWFDYPKIWPEIARVLKPKGTVAFWTYGENYLPSHPDLFDEVRKFMSSKTSLLAPYWGQPGRRILENLLLDVPFPFELDAASGAIWDKESATRKHHKLIGPGEPDLAWARGEAPEETFRMEHIKSFDQLNGYFHTASASSQYFKAHPELKAEKPDFIDRHTAKLRQHVLQQRREAGASDDGLDDDHIRVAWPLGLLMIRKSA